MKFLADISWGKMNIGRGKPPCWPAVVCAHPANYPMTPWQLWHRPSPINTIDNGQRSLGKKELLQLLQLLQSLQLLQLLQLLQAFGFLWFLISMINMTFPTPQTWIPLVGDISWYFQGEILTKKFFSSAIVRSNFGNKTFHFPSGTLKVVKPPHQWLVFTMVFTPDFGKKSHSKSPIKPSGLALQKSSWKFRKFPALAQLRWSVSALIIEALAMWLCAAWWWPMDSPWWVAGHVAAEVVTSFVNSDYNDHCPIFGGARYHWYIFDYICIMFSQFRPFSDWELSGIILTRYTWRME